MLLKQTRLVKAPQTKEGVIIECTLNELFHDRRDVIITSRMFVINISLTVAVNFFFFF